MKNQFLLFSLTTLAFILLLVTNVETNPTETVCHNGKTLTVQKSAVAAHLAHGDTLGECN